MLKLRLIVLAAAMAALLTLGAGVSQAAPGIPYTLHGTFQETFMDEGFCTSEALITVDSKWVLHANATQAGLTEEEIFEALDDDSSGLIVSATYTETGTFTLVEAGRTITGRFTAWFGGNVNAGGHTIVFTGTFSARGVDQDGNRFVATFNGHLTLVNGESVVELERGKVKGCPDA